MRTSRMWSIMAILLVISMALAACGATPTATPIPPTAVPPTATKAPVPTNTTAPVAPTATTAAAAAPTAVPPTATKPAATNTAVPPTAVPPTATVAAAPRKGGTLINGADAMIANWQVFSIPGQQMMRAFRFVAVRLINLDGQNNYIPDLAKTWTISPDGLTYTFNLRNDAMWSDGTKITSQDVAVTFNLHCQKDTASGKFTVLKVIAGCQDVYDGKATSVSGIKMLDSYTVVMQLTIASPAFLYEMSNEPIVPNAIFSKIAPKDIAASDYVVKGPSLSAGPFMLKSFTPNEQYELVANPKYYGGMPKLDTYIEKKIPDRNTRLLAFEKGEVDIIDDGLATDYDRMMKLPGVTSLTFPGTIQMLWINSHSDAANPKDPKYVAMNTPAFRQALVYAIDRTAIANLQTGGHPENWTDRNCVWTNGIFGMGTCDPSEPKYSYDFAKAQTLLKQSGWDSKWELQYRPYTTGAPTPVDEAIQQMWTKLGLKVTLQGFDAAVIIDETYVKGNFDVTSLGLSLTGNMMDFLYRFRCNNVRNLQTNPAGLNLMRYCNADYDKAVTAATTATDPKVYEPLLKQADTLILTDLPIITEGYAKVFRLVGPKVDAKTIEVGNRYSWENAQNWSLK
jgi:peptide/nickel transport system substrate-binding protein